MHTYNITIPINKYIATWYVAIYALYPLNGYLKSCVLINCQSFLLCNHKYYDDITIHKAM